MKKLLLILPFLIVGCVSTIPQMTTSGQERMEICKIKSKESYWGDCYIKSGKSDPNYQSVKAYTTKNYPKAQSAWNVVEFLNFDLLARLESKTIDVETANLEIQEKLDWYYKVFTDEYNFKIAQEEQKRQQTALAWQQLGEALNQSTATLNQNNPAYNQNQNTVKNTGFLKDEYVSGFNKVCIYDGISGTFTLNISSTGICPLSAQQ